jgi:hypothetical protein
MTDTDNMIRSCDERKSDHDDDYGLRPFTWDHPAVVVQAVAATAVYVDEHDNVARARVTASQTVTATVTASVTLIRPCERRRRNDRFLVYREFVRCIGKFALGRIDNFGEAEAVCVRPKVPKVRVP